jgi:hypothetical protein
MKDTPNSEPPAAASDLTPRRPSAATFGSLPGTRLGPADELGILLAAADNDGLVVLSGKPDLLLARNLLKRAPAPSPRFAYTLTEEGWEALRASKAARDPG